MSETLSQDQIVANSNTTLPPIAGGVEAQPWVSDGVIQRAPTKEELLHYGYRQLPPTEKMSFPGVEVKPSETQRKLGRLVGRLLNRRGSDPSEGEDFSLLGQTRKHEYVAQPTRNEFGYGNELQRMKALKSMSFEKFKNRLLTMNSALRLRGVDDAQGEEGYTIYGRAASRKGNLPHHYPDARDTMEILEYAFSQAQAAPNIQDAAQVLSGGFVAAHPFADGNGRVSRALYAELSGGLNPDSNAYKLATGSASKMNALGGARQMVAMGSEVLKTNNALALVHKRFVYDHSGVEPLKEYVTNYEHDVDPATGLFKGLPQSAFEGLDESQKEWLDLGYRNGQGVTEDLRDFAWDRGTDEVMQFAMAYAFQKNPDQKHLFVTDQIDEVKLPMVDLRAVFSKADVNLRKAIADGVREFYKQHALAYIDMLSEKGRHEMIETRNRAGEPTGKVSVHDLIIERSKTFVAEPVEFPLDDSQRAVLEEKMTS